MDLNSFKILYGFSKENGIKSMDNVNAWAVEPQIEGSSEEDNIRNKDTNMVTGPLTVLAAVNIFEKNIAEKNKTKLTGGWSGWRGLFGVGLCPCLSKWRNR